ncbi:MAG: DNA-binding response regulator [Chitinophagaceae bacterium]|nr:MAG: DNA-binding response regulator [Chitinophagaceae bacterium]
MSASKRTVLIVEDEYLLYDELQEFFTEKGFKVITKSDGSAIDSYQDAVDLLKTEEPDVAILDIEIKGKKDGIELAGYIRDHFHSLVILLTGHNNYMNIERARGVNADGFVLKIEKPFNKEQLWATIALALPKVKLRQLRKSRGEFFKVREVEVNKTAKSNNNNARDLTDPLDIETFIAWDTITYVESFNSKTGFGNNNILIHTVSGKKGYVCRGTLSEIALQLPDYFVRFDQSFIVNLHHITAKGRGSSLRR